MAGQGKELQGGQAVSGRVFHVACVKRLIEHCPRFDEGGSCLIALARLSYIVPAPLSSTTNSSGRLFCPFPILSLSIVHSAARAHSRHTLYQHGSRASPVDSRAARVHDHKCVLAVDCLTELYGLTVAIAFDSPHTSVLGAWEGLRDVGLTEAYSYRGVRCTCNGRSNICLRACLCHDSLTPSPDAGSTPQVNDHVDLDLPQYKTIPCYLALFILAE